MFVYSTAVEHSHTGDEEPLFEIDGFEVRADNTDSISHFQVSPQAMTEDSVPSVGRISSEMCYHELSFLSGSPVGQNSFVSSTSTRISSLSSSVCVMKQDKPQSHQTDVELLRHTAALDSIAKLQISSPKGKEKAAEDEILSSSSFSSSESTCVCEDHHDDSQKHLGAGPSSAPMVIYNGEATGIRLNGLFTEFSEDSVNLIPRYRSLSFLRNRQEATPAIHSSRQSNLTSQRLLLHQRDVESYCKVTSSSSKCASTVPHIQDLPMPKKTSSIRISEIGSGSLESFSNQSATRRIPPYIIDSASSSLTIARRKSIDDILPQELLIRILKALITVHEDAREQQIQSQNWSIKAATDARNRWTGRASGMLELVRLSRVSKRWQSLAFDGQIWSTLDLHFFPNMPSCVLRRVITSSGPFIRVANLSGNLTLSTSDLSEISIKTSCMDQQPSFNQLSNVNLSGCRSLTTPSLHSLLINSPSLSVLNLRGLPIVTNATTSILAVHCKRLISLNLGFCANINAQGLEQLINFCPCIKELKVPGLKGVTKEFMATLGLTLHELEVLDLSNIQDLYDSGIEAFTNTSESEAEREIITLTSREAGYDVTDLKKYRRRVMPLRHLSLSGCSSLSDTACSFLAYAVPKIQCLELAGIGSRLRDTGLSMLFRTTPMIKRIDLEDASSITDAVLEVLTPMESQLYGEHKVAGQLLEHIILSHAINLSNDALQTLIQRCPHLRVLELDNTRVSGATIKDFVSVMKDREIRGSEIIVTDCRNFGEAIIKDISTYIRPRRGWREWEARKLEYLDYRDIGDAQMGQDECDENRTVLKSFHTWQAVDSVARARARARKSTNDRLRTSGVTERTIRGTLRWWSPHARRSVESNATESEVRSQDRENCIIM